MNRLAATWIQTRLKADDFRSVLADEDADIDNKWERLVARLVAENDTGRLMADRYNPHDESIIERLPTETQELLFRRAEHDEEREHERTNAAFLFGVALGRQLGGAQ